MIRLSGPPGPSKKKMGSLNIGGGSSYHVTEILAELGYHPEEIEAFKTEKVVG